MGSRPIVQSGLPDRTSPESGDGWQRRRSDANVTILDPVSLTEQSHRDSCDINIILAKYEKSGVIPLGKDGQPFFGDFSEVPDFHSAQLAILEAEQSFMQLPAKLRSRFDNDPGKLLAFLEDPANKDEAISLGLINKPAASVPPAPTPEPNPVPAPSPAPPSTKS